MSIHIERTNLLKPALVLALAGLLASSPAMAKQDNEKGGGNPHKSEQAGKKGGDEQHGKSQGSGKSHDSAKGNDAGKSHGKGGGKAVGKAGTNFDDRQRNVLRNYFQTEFKRGSCPPGLAKKHNGCMPPGQAKKWQVGQRLPRDVIFHDLPNWVLRDLGRAPDGHKYVRVDDDVLLLGIATGVVIDALSGLGGL